MVHRNIILISLILIGLDLKGQDTLLLKSIKQFEDSIIRRYYLYDTAGNIIINYNNGMNGDVVMIFGFCYDSLNRKIKSINAHSNVGFSVWEHEPHPNGNTFKTFSYDEPAAQQGHIEKFNTWLHIQNYFSIKQLENDSSVQWILNNNTKHLIFHYEYDDYGNKVKNFHFNSSGDTIGRSSTEFNCINKKCYKSKEGIYNYSYDNFGNKLMIFTINPSGDTIIDTEYRYDNRNLLIEMIEYYDNELFYVSKFYYDNENLIKELHFRNNKKLTYERYIEYDKNGNKTKETENDRVLKRQHTYQWKYEYY